MTGREPEWFLSDVRDPDRAGLVAAEDALRRDFHVRLFNRKWIEGMMKEGYAGADQIAVHVSNAMGWAIMRDGSVSDDVWNEIAAVYVNDKYALSLRQWFEAENPYAFQDMSEVMLESSRKGYWQAEPGLLRRVAAEYARSVIRHGEGAGLRGGGNLKMEQFVAAALRSAKSAEMEQLAAEYQGRIRQTQLVQAAASAASTAPGHGRAAAMAGVPARSLAKAPDSATAKAAGAESAAASDAKVPAAIPTAVVGAKKLTPAPPAGTRNADAETGPGRWPLLAAIASVALLLLLCGFVYRRGMP